MVEQHARTFVCYDRGEGEVSEMVEALKQIYSVHEEFAKVGAKKFLRDADDFMAIHRSRMKVGRASAPSATSTSAMLDGAKAPTLDFENSEFADAPPGLDDPFGARMSAPGGLSVLDQVN